ncbi:MAG: DUF3794 domain-containing protein, partial [Oscillospiraceae bacterium]|nr:DUF3794 domain-containing protein [Candidatus Equicaccousia limihippi]
SYSVCGIYEKNVVYNDIITVKEPMNDIKTVLRKNSVASVEDCKIIGKKAIVKGEIKTDFIYIDNLGGLQKLRAILPYSYVIDINEQEGEDLSYFATGDVYSTEIIPNIDDSETFSSYAIKCKLNIYLKICKKNEAEIITDLYSTKFSEQIESDLIKITDYYGISSENILVKKDIDLNENLTEIYDVWFNGEIGSEEIIDGSLDAKGEIHLECICKQSDGTPYLYTQTIEFEYSENREYGTNYDFDYQFIPTDCKFAVKNKKLSVECVGMLTITAKSEMKINAVTDVSFEETETTDNSQIIVYYPDQNEDLWEIAKHFKSDSDNISVDNNADGLQSRALIIQR